MLSASGRDARMSEYKKVDAETYQVTSDNGTHAIKRSTMGIVLVLPNVSRNSSRGTDRTEPEAGEKTKNYIQAKWKPDHYHFELISEADGQKRVKLPIYVTISVGDPKYCSFAHWKALGESEEQFLVGFYVSQESFDWLWNEIQQRPTAKVSIRTHLNLWLAGIESHMYYEVNYNPIRLEPEEHVKILDAMFHVTDPDSNDEEKGEPEDEHATRIEKWEQNFLSAKDSVWFSRIFFALLAIVALLLFKR